MAATIDDIMTLLREAGAHRYGDERVSQLAHALQCARRAENEGAPASLVVAALLHDLGHLVGKGDEGAAARGVDRKHEAVAAGYLRGAFAKSVTEPIRLHVAAKQYLCHADAGYLAHLSPASVTSLQVQGGIFDAEAAAAFIARPYAADAVRLRRWDDDAKDPDAATPDLAYYRPLVEAQICAERD